jgi:hypothetical protein
MYTQAGQICFDDGDATRLAAVKPSPSHFSTGTPALIYPPHSQHRLLPSPNRITSTCAPIPGSPTYSYSNWLADFIVLPGSCFQYLDPVEP